MERSFSNPDGVHTPVGAYSHVARLDTGDTTLLFVSGQVALDRDGRLVGPGDVVRQAEQVYENIETILEAHGAAMTDVLKITTYLADFSQMAGFRELRRRRFPAEAPASTVVGVTRLAREEFLVEAEAVAAIPRRPGT